CEIGALFRIVNPVSAAKHGRAHMRQHPGKADARSNVIQVISEGLTFIANAKIKGEPGAHVVRILEEDVPERFPDVVVLVTESLREAGDNRRVLLGGSSCSTQRGLGLTGIERDQNSGRESGAGRIHGKASQSEAATKLLAKSAGGRPDHIGAALERVSSA